MKKLKHLLEALAVIFSGMITGSLWFTHTDNWKIYLPIVLICLILRLAFLKETE